MSGEKTFLGGTHIKEAAKELVAEAVRSGKTVIGRFNDILLTAEPTTTPADVEAAFDRDIAAASEAYRNSPAGREAEHRRVESIQSAQQKADDLVAQLPTLNFSDPSAVIDWITAMQDPSDTSGVRIPKNDILIRFAEHGWKPGMNCGADYRDDDLDNRAHWIVGQALDTLSRVSIHPIVHKFANEWRAARSKSS